MSCSLICVGPRAPHERRMLTPRLCAAAMALACMWPSLGAAHTAPYLPVMGGSVHAASAPLAAPSRAIGTWTSKEGESRDDFVLRVAVPLHAYTDKTGFETCGVLMKENQGTRWRLRVTTNQSQLGCLLVSFDDPAFSPTEESLHTHPADGNITPNVHDVALFPRSGFRAGHERYTVNGGDFSPLDYAGGPGYVVTPGGVPFGRPHLLHQEGSATSRRDLGRLPSMDLAATAPDEDATWTTQLASDDSTPTSSISAVSVRAQP